MDEATEQAFRIVGGTRAMARLVGASAAAVHVWRHRGRIPAEHILEIERAVESRVTRYQLRPDVYGPAQ